MSRTGYNHLFFDKIFAKSWDYSKIVDSVFAVRSTWPYDTHQLKWLNVDQVLNSQKTPHSSPWQVSYGVSLVTTLEKIYHILMRLNHIKYHRELIPKLLSSLILWLISISLHPTQHYSRKPITIHHFMWIYNNFIGKDIFLYWPDNILSSYLLLLFMTSRGLIQYDDAVLPV